MWFIVILGLAAAGDGGQTPGGDTAATQLIGAESSFVKTQISGYNKKKGLDEALNKIKAVSERVNKIENDYLKAEDKTALQQATSAVEAKAEANVKAVQESVEALEKQGLAAQITAVKNSLEKLNTDLTQQINNLNSELNNVKGSVTAAEKSIQENAKATAKEKAKRKELKKEVKTNTKSLDALVECHVTAPENGAMGECENVLDPEAECEPVCNNGYEKKGKTSCALPKVGRLTVAQCNALTCSAWQLPTGVTGLQSSPKPCSSEVNLDAGERTNQCEVTCDSDQGYVPADGGAESGTITCEADDSGKVSLQGTDFKCEKQDAPAKEEAAPAPKQEAAKQEAPADDGAAADQGGDGAAADQGGDDGGSGNGEASVAKNQWPEPSAEEWVASPRMLALESDLNGWKFAFYLLAAFNLGMATMYCYGKKQNSSHVRTPLLP